MEKDPAIYVRHMLEAIANIETDTEGGMTSRSFARIGARGSLLNEISRFCPRPAAAFPRS